MAWYPDAIARPIPPGASDPVIIPVGIVLHVDAGNATSLHDYFDGPSGIESHFHVQRDGDVEQYRDTGREADANYRGNSWPVGKGRHGLLSVETQGFELGEWTSAQLESIKALIRWAAREHGFPMQVAPSWQGPGVGYHVQWGAPGPWTPVAKTCPGPDRVRQFQQIIVPWLQGEEDDMTPAQAEMLEDLHTALVNGNGDQVINPRTRKDVSVRYAAQEGWQTAEQLFDVLCNGNTTEMRRPGGGTASVRYGVERTWAGVQAVKAMLAELAAGPAGDLDEFLARVEQRVERATAAGIDAEIPAVVTAVLDALGDRAGLDQDDVVEAVKQALREGADAE